MAATGRFLGSLVGADSPLAGSLIAGGATTVALAALNAGAAFRFIAPDTRDVISVYVNFSAVTAAGEITLTIETIDATTGKPTGTLYDAAATKAFTPVTGWQIVTFDTPPTTGLTAGTEYAIVLLTTTGGTTMTLRGYVSAASAGAHYPTICLTAADGTTRSNFAEVTNSVPCCSIVFDDSVEECPALTPYATVTTRSIFTTNASGMKFVVPTGETWTAHGVLIAVLIRNGTPAGDLRVRIFNSSDATVANSTVTADKESLLNVNSRRAYLPFTGLVTLTAGTYRIVLDSALSADSSNCWRCNSVVARVAGLVPSGAIQTSTTDVTAGTITWTDTDTEQSPAVLVLDDNTAAGGAGPETHGSLLGGIHQ